MSTTKQSKTKTNKKTKDKSTFQVTREALKIDRRGFSMNLFWFAFLTIASLCLAYVFVETLVITIPFVVIPSYFAFSSVNSMKETKDHENMGFFVMFRTYFSKLFFGGYRVISGLLKSLVAYILGEAIIVVGCETIFLRNDPAYQVFEKKIAELGVSDVDTLLKETENFVSGNQTYANIIFLSSTIALAIALFVFVVHMTKHSIKMKRNFFTKQVMPMKEFSIIDKKVRRENKKSYSYDYFRGFWFVHLIQLVVSLCGVAIGFYFIKDLDVAKTFVIILFLMFIVTLPMFNYISKCNEVMYLAYAQEYEETAIKMTLEFLTKYKEKIGIADEDAKKIEDMLNNSKQELESKKEDNKKDKEK